MFKNTSKLLIKQHNDNHMKLINHFTVSSKNPELPFFISEITENPKNKSTLFLFGKTVLNKEYVNCVVNVNNVQREIFVMPKEGKTVEEVEKEIKELMKKNSAMKKIPADFSKVNKRYCFELDVDHRNEMTEVLKISYSFRYRNLSGLKDQGQTYKGIFGNTYKALEMFML